MDTKNVKKLAMAAMLTAVAVVGSMINFPVFGSKCSPVQHMVNILCAFFLGPVYGLASAFTASLIRNMLSLGSILAFPGSMFGALLCGFTYKKTKNIFLTCRAEVFGTAVIGGLAAYPLSLIFMGKAAGDIAFYAYIIPFLISTAVGSALSWAVLTALNYTGVLSRLQREMEK